MSFENSLIFGLIGISGILIYASTTIDTGEDDQEKGTNFDPILAGMKLFLFLIGIVVLTTVPSMMWHVTDFTDSGCSSNCTELANVKTVVNTVQWPVQYLVGILVFFFGLFIFMKILKVGIGFAIEKIRGRERRRRK